MSLSRPNFDTRKEVEKSKKSASSSVDEKAPPQEEARYVGYYASEVSFLDRVHNGGSTGANYNLALHHAFKK